MVEHYRKVSSKHIEDALLPNEIRISPSTKPNDFLHRAVALLNAHSSVVVSGCGDDCTKVVSLVEQHLKKKTVQTLKQSTRIKYNKIEDLWIADLEGLDNLKVVRHIPVLSVILVTSEPVSLKTQEPAKGKSKGRQQTRQHSKAQQTQSHSKSSQTQAHSKPSQTQSQTHQKT